MHINPPHIQSQQFLAKKLHQNITCASLCAEATDQLIDQPTDQHSDYYIPSEPNFGGGVVKRGMIM